MAKANTYTTSAAARSEIVAAVRWNEARSRHAGPAFRAAVRRLLELLVQFPGLGELHDDTLRVAQVEGYSYIVVYRETTRGVRVIAVAHTSREPDYWADRA